MSQHSKKTYRGGAITNVVAVVGEELPEWESDHAASGWRSRAFLKHAEVIVYDTGEWEIRPKGGMGQATCGGKEVDAKSGEFRALNVYTALFSSRMKP